MCTGLNLGYGKGNNYGLKKVKTNYALILNPDIICKNGFLKKINKSLKKIINFQLLDVSTRIKQNIYQQVFLIKNIISFKKTFQS